MKNNSTSLNLHKSHQKLVFFSATFQCIIYYNPFRRIQCTKDVRYTILHYVSLGSRFYV